MANSLAVTAIAIMLALGTRTDELGELTKLAKDRWNQELATLFPVNMAYESQINNYMLSQCRDRAILYHGGSGARTLYFLLDDVHQVSFKIDGKGLLLKAPLVEDRQVWIKDYGGRLLDRPVRRK